MSAEEQDIDARLARLSGATAGLQASAGFSSRVMQRVGQERPGMLLTLQRPARRILPLSMLAAALALVWAVSAQQQVNEAMAISDDAELAAW